MLVINPGKTAWVQVSLIQRFRASEEVCQDSSKIQNWILSQFNFSTPDSDLRKKQKVLKLLSENRSAVFIQFFCAPDYIIAIPKFYTGTAIRKFQNSKQDRDLHYCFFLVWNFYK